MKLPKIPKLPKKSTMNRQANAHEISEFMDKHGLSEIEMSQRLSVSVQTVNYWRNGHRVANACTTKFIRLLDKYPQLIREL